MAEELRGSLARSPLSWPPDHLGDPAKPLVATPRLMLADCGPAPQDLEKKLAALRSGDRTVSKVCCSAQDDCCISTYSQIQSCHERTGVISLPQVRYLALQSSGVPTCRLIFPT